MAQYGPVWPSMALYGHCMVGYGVYLPGYTPARTHLLHAADLGAAAGATRSALPPGRARWH